MKSISAALIYGTAVLIFISCSEEPSTYVGDLDQITTGFITGVVIDSSTSNPLPDVEVRVTDIFTPSDFELTAYTDSNGIFMIDSVFEREYYISFESAGYQSETLLVKIEDSLKISNPIALQRLKFPFNEVMIDYFPTDSSTNGVYYELNLPAYQNEFGWMIGYKADVEYLQKIYLKIDSVLISLLRDDMNPDTAWYKFYQGACGNALPSFDPQFIVKLEQENSTMLSHNFVVYDFKLNVPENCIDSSEVILKYTYFY